MRHRRRPRVPYSDALREINEARRNLNDLTLAKIPPAPSVAAHNNPGVAIMVEVEVHHPAEGHPLVHRLVPTPAASSHPLAHGRTSSSEGP